MYHHSHNYAEPTVVAWYQVYSDACLDEFILRQSKGTVWCQLMLSMSTCPQGSAWRCVWLKLRHPPKSTTVCCASMPTVHVPGETKDAASCKKCNVAASLSETLPCVLFGSIMKGYATHLFSRQTHTYCGMNWTVYTYIDAWSYHYT